MSKKWDEALEKPPIDYAEIFDADVGQVPGEMKYVFILP